MVHYVKIENFGPIKDEVELNFETDALQPDDNEYVAVMADGRKLLKLIYIYGANASGKTTILKAFDFFRKLLLRPVQNKSIELDYDPFLFCQNPYEKPSCFELAFYANEVRHIYTIKFNRQGILNERLIYYHSAKPTELFSRETDLEKRLSRILFGSRSKVTVREKDLLESNTLHNNTVFGAYTKTNVDIPELEVLNIWLDNFLLGLITSGNDITNETAEQIAGNPKANKWVNAFLNKADRQISEVNVNQQDKSLHTAIVPDYYDEPNVFNSGSPHPDVSFIVPDQIPGRRKIEFTHKTGEGNSYRLPIAAESNGTQRYFALGGPLYKLVHGNHLLCIDELETSLHPDLMKHFMQTFLANAGQSQMLITTHNVALMEELDFIRRDALWFSEKNTDGSVALYSAADFDSITLRKSASIINAYRAGRLGAKPNLGSPYITTS
jgi:AAA15 family ATPase/GTPase